jgi:GDP-L-fucose synthase
VGGILANDAYPADFIRDNLFIQNNVIDAAYRYGSTKLCFLGSSCIYPRLAPQPMREDSLLTGELEPTNQWYATAKIAGIKMCEAYHKQFGFRGINLMPTNLYGPHDNFDLETSHVLPAMIRKFHLGKCLERGDWPGLRLDLDARPIGAVNGSASSGRILDALAKHGIGQHGRQPLNTASMKGDRKGDSPVSSQAGYAEKHSGRVTITLWGTGEPRREFLHVDDLAHACVFLTQSCEGMELVNVGVGQDIPIRELAAKVGEVVGFGGGIAFDSSMPDGTPRKLLDVSKLSSFGWQPHISLKDGIRHTYAWYSSH